MPKKILYSLILLVSVCCTAAASSKEAKGAAVSAPAPAPSSTSSTRQFDTSASLIDGTPIVLTIVSATSQESSAYSALSYALAKIVAMDREFLSADGLEVKLNTLPSDKEITLSAQSYDFIKKAVHLAALTNGWFDITAPSEKGLFMQKDWRRLDLNESTHTVSTKCAGIKFDLRRLAIAYFTDVAFETLSEGGFENINVYIGGVQRNKGRDIFTPWAIQVDFGNQRQDSYAYRSFQLGISNIASSTITPDGLGKGLVDAHSKRPVPSNLQKSVTVFANDATMALAYSVVAYTLGPKNGFKFVESRPEIKGVIVDNQGNIFASESLRAKLHQESGEPATAPNAVPQKDLGPNDLKQKQLEEEKYD